MKKLLIVSVLALVSVVAFAQNYKSRLPTPTEQRKLAGVTDWIQDGPRYGILFTTPIPEQVVTNSDTNSIVVLNSTSALTNCFLQMQNPTNRSRYAIEVVGRGNITIVLTTSNITAANSVGPGFNTMTNIQAATYTIPTNSAALVISTGTNYLVVPTGFR